MSKQTITAFFDTRSHAEHAALALKQAGLPAADVSVSPETALDDLGATGGYAGATGTKKTGFWASLEEMFGGSDDHATYTEGLRRGGTMLTAHVDDANTDEAIALLEQHGAVDLVEREGTWRGLVRRLYEFRDGHLRCRRRRRGGPCDDRHRACRQGDHD